jgi:hypothetical protein
MLDDFKSRDQADTFRGGRIPGHELFYFNERNELMAGTRELRTHATVGNPAKVLDARYFAGAPGANART